MKIQFVDFNDLFNSKNVITNHEPVNTKTKKFNPDGIFSEEVFGKLDNEGLQYSCSCGKIKGKFLLNTICDTCNTPVKFTEATVKKLGWIDLGDYYIISPIFYSFIQQLFSKKILNKIISYEVKLSKDGLELNTDEINEANPEVDVKEITPYANYGLENFRNNFVEILNHHYKTSKATRKDELYKIITDNINLVFTNKMPAFSTVLRPALMMGESLVFDEINNAYNALINSSNIIKNTIEAERSDINILPILLNLQIQANLIHEKTINAIKGKEGFIRSNILGSRINNSARNVITPLPIGHDIDEIVLPYKTFAEVYKLQIINIIRKTKNINHNKAHDIWNKAISKFDQELYDIMMDIINRTKGGCQVLLNRNPSINFGSILTLRITGIKKDYSDLTASIHNCILAPLNADYDGDCLNIIPLLDNAMKETFKIFNPKRMLIDNNNGKFNPALNLDKDQVLGIYTFNKR